MKTLFLIPLKTEIVGLPLIAGIVGGTSAGRRKSFVVSWNDDPAGLSVASVEPPAVYIRRFFIGIRCRFLLGEP